MFKRFFPAIVAIALAVFTATVISSGPADPAQAAAGDEVWVEHPGVVPDSPKTGYPIIHDTPIAGNPPLQTRAVDLVGNYIISGGDFTTIELQDGTLINQPYLAIVDWRTKQLVCTDLDVDDEVWSIAPGPDPDTVIIGGRFNRITGPDGVERVRNKIALLDMDTCEVDKTWIVNGLNGKVTELAVRNNRLFLGGDFTNIEGLPIEHLAEVDHTTTTLNPSFSFEFAGDIGRMIVAMELSPDASRLGIVHRSTMIAGQPLRATAIFDISDQNTPTLTNHRISTLANSYTYYFDIQAGAFSPDFSKVGLANGTATVSDYVTVLPTTEAPDQFGWEHFMRDSSFGMAMTNSTAYVTGHFCKIDEGPGATDVMAPSSGPSTCTGTLPFYEGGAFRTQLAALDITDGTPLTWNPGNDALVGGRAVTVVNRGLLVGFDGDRTDDIRTGTTAFFDFGAPPPPEDPRVGQTCTAVGNGFDVDLTWDDVPEINNFIVRRNSGWVASPGDVTSYTDSPPAGTHTYYIRTSYEGVQWDTTCNPTVTVEAPPAQTCTATLNPDDSITVNWDQIAGEDTYIVRRNAAFIANVGPALTYTESPGDGVFTYVIRSRMAGVTTNTTCAPTITVDIPPPPPQTCSATDNGDGTVTLVWDEIEGEDKYTVRRDNVWITDVLNELTYEVTGHTAGDTYVIRSRMAGVTTDTNCV